MKDNKELALALAVETLGYAPNIERNQGDWVINLARRYESFLDEGKDIQVTLPIDEYQVILESYGRSILKAIREIQIITGLSLVEVTSIAKNTPSILKSQILLDEAILIKKRLQEIGAIVRIEICSNN